MPDEATQSPKALCLRYSGRCRKCEIEPPSGPIVVDDREAKSVTCLACMLERTSAAPQVAGPISSLSCDDPESALQKPALEQSQVFAGVAGACAQRLCSTPVRATQERAGDTDPRGPPTPGPTARCTRRGLFCWWMLRFGGIAPYAACVKSVMIPLVCATVLLLVTGCAPVAPTFSRWWLRRRPSRSVRRPHSSSPSPARWSGPVVGTGVLSSPDGSISGAVPVVSTDRGTFDLTFALESTTSNDWWSTCRPSRGMNSAIATRDS